MNYPYKYSVVMYHDDNYGESYSNCFFCDYDDAKEYFESLVASGRCCMLYRLLEYENFKL